MAPFTADVWENIPASSEIIMWVMIAALVAVFIIDGFLPDGADEPNSRKGKK
jgi:hypothetical protein